MCILASKNQGFRVVSILSPESKRLKLNMVDIIIVSAGASNDDATGPSTIIDPWQFTT